MSEKIKVVICGSLIEPRSGDVGYDLTAKNVIMEDKYVEYGTGVYLDMPLGYHAEVFPRSSLSKMDLLMCNSVGLIDNSYRGEIKLRFKKLGDDIYKVGDKIGQIVFKKSVYAEISHVMSPDFLSDTVRGSGGFGSTGS